MEVSRSGCRSGQVTRDTFVFLRCLFLAQIQQIFNVQSNHPLRKRLKICDEILSNRICRKVTRVAPLNATKLAKGGQNLLVGISFPPLRLFFSLFCPCVATCYREENVTRMELKVDVTTTQNTKDFRTHRRFCPFAAH